MHGNPNGKLTVGGEKATAKLDCRVPETLKSEFVSICRTHGFIPGALNRRLVEEVVAEYRKSGVASLKKHLKPLPLEDWSAE